MKKLIEKTALYCMYQSDFRGYTQIFRHWYNNVVELKFTDDFARANEYKDIEDMFSQNVGMKESLIFYCGKIPEWIRIDENGNFAVKKTQGNLSYN